MAKYVVIADWDFTVHGDYDCAVHHIGWVQVSEPDIPMGLVHDESGGYSRSSLKGNHNEAQNWDYCVCHITGIPAHRTV